MIRDSMIHLLALAVALLAVTAAPLPGFAQDQPDVERRRSDPQPIVLKGGSKVEFRSFNSRCLGADAHYSIFFPPSYEKDSGRSFPVVYFLHGLNNDETSWTVQRYGHIQDALEAMMAAGALPEFVMVHPRGDSGFYCNYKDGSRLYEDFVTTELVEHVEAQFRIRKGRENRAIAGTSMGGYGALKIAMKYPDRYAAVAGQSSIIFPGSNPLDVPEEMKASRFYTFFINMLKPIFGDPIEQDLWDRNNPLVLAKSAKLASANLASAKLDGLGIYFDYGTDDRYIQMVRLDAGNQALDRILTEARVPHTFKIHPGEPHGWALVASHLVDTMPFLCRSFKK